MLLYGSIWRLRASFGAAFDCNPFNIQPELCKKILKWILQIMTPVNQSVSRTAQSCLSLLYLIHPAG
jgi:hypothetical protein